MNFKTILFLWDFSWGSYKLTRLNRRKVFCTEPEEDKPKNSWQIFLNRPLKHFEKYIQEIDFIHSTTLSKQPSTVYHNLIARKSINVLIYIDVINLIIHDIA